jgi:hypothetical protein
LAAVPKLALFMKAFISYSHKDSKFLDDFREHLSALKRQNLLEEWTDHEIHPGEIIDECVHEQMESAELFLLLVSSSFLASEYCYNREFQRALERQEAGLARIVPIIIRECDWRIPQLQKFKALPKDGKAVASPHWSSIDAGFANVVESLRRLLKGGITPTSNVKPVRKSKSKFLADETHVTEEQRGALKEVAEEVVKRLTIKEVAESPEVFKAAQGRAFGSVWSSFNKHFGTVEHGLASLPREKFEEAKRWLIQYRASKNKNLKIADPEAYRISLTTPIYATANELGWSKAMVFSFAAEKLGYRAEIRSLHDLGNNQLELLLSRIRYERRKKNIESAQARLRRKSDQAEDPSRI